jgi:hypothetical protein
MELNDDTVEIFRQNVKQFTQIDKLISDLKEQMKPYLERIKQLKLEKAELEKNLCMTMEANDLKQAELPNKSGIVEYKVKQSMVPVTQKTLKEKMILFFEEDEGSKISFNSLTAKNKGSVIYDYIYGKQNRKFIKKETIKSKNI